MAAYTVHDAKLEPDELLPHLAKLVEGWDPPGDVQFSNELAKRICASVDTTSKYGGQTELDSHANMCVFGKHSMMISESMKTVNVSNFAAEAGQLNKVPIVDAMVAYDCKRTNQVFLLVARNVLYVESMEINLIPPFILREKGLKVRDVPKTQCEEPTVDDHMIQDTESGIFIPLSLYGTFSTFNTRKPTQDDILNGTVVVITPEGSSWNPYCDSYAENED